MLSTKVNVAAGAAPNPETSPAGFGIYVHWPFCLSKCPYCDFNSHVRESVDQSRWRRALLAELDHYAEQTPGRRVTSLFFGGGTPSLMAPETAAAVIERVAERWPFGGGVHGGIEITLEANPTSVEAGRFRALRAAGINRLSLGVQALDEAALKFLGRGHDVVEALEALATARRCFSRVSFDLIYARPGQTPAAWRDELARALAEDTEHLSLYQLTIEPGTAFHAARRRGTLPAVEEETAARLYETTQDMMAAAGLPAYEISNHARPGAACRHNLTYWRYGDYVGVGPGAHGRLTFGARKVATRQHRAPEAWLAAVERDGHATRGRAPVTGEDRLSELVMMGLRLRGGIAREAFHREVAAEPEDALDGRRLAALRDEGLLQLDRAGLRATDAGRQRLDALLGYLLA